ncbi:MAG: porin family protein [Pseudomonadales bacterium]|nr:porin family protein [Pseudomonadales bacterium]
MRYWMLFGLLVSPALWAEPVAHYQDQRFGYVAGNLMHLNLDYDSREVTPTGLGVRLGGMVDPHWGVELRVGVGPSPDTWRADTGRNKVDYTVDHVGALLATGRLPFKSPVKLPYVDSLFVQGYAGVADVKVKTVRRRCAGNVCDDDTARNDDTSLAFGAGVGLRTEFNLGLTLQYMQYVDKDYITVTGIEGGLEWYF